MNGRLIEIVPYANHRKHKGGNLKNKLIRPWLTGSGVERPTSELKEISRYWSEQTWAEYLNWFQSGNSENLVSQRVYEKISEELEINVFENFGYETCPALQSFCERLLSILPLHQQRILRGFYLEGKTSFKIAAQLKRSTTNIYYNKNKALRSLKREHDGEKWRARQYMRGAKKFNPKIEDSIWSENLSHPIRERRAYGISDHHNEHLGHKSPELRQVFSELSERSYQIIYLKFWCELNHAQIARKCSLGLNTVETIIESAVYKIKSKIAKNQKSDKIAG